jgi:hypothetical protein
VCPILKVWDVGAGGFSKMVAVNLKFKIKIKIKMKQVFAANI